MLFLADLGLALLTKVAPQLNAISVMFPAKIGLTLLLVGLSFAGAARRDDPAARDLVTQAMAAIAARRDAG